jgi:prophage antirepressor-like protein
MSDSEEEYPTITQIDESENIISSLVENIYHDDSYQEYLKDLEESDIKGDAKKLVNIKKTFSDIRIFGDHSNPLFLMKDIGVIIGASNVNVMTKNYNNKERLDAYLLTDGKVRKNAFLTKHGVYRVLFSNKSKLSELFRSFVYKIMDYMINYENESLKRIINELKSEQPELVMDSMNEMSENAAKYREMYEREREERLLIESEKIDLESDMAYSEMYIEQLRIDKQNIVEKINSRTYDDALDEVNVAFETLKKKCLKEFSISLVAPHILDKIFDPKRTEYDIDNEKYILNRYKSDFDFIIKTFEIKKEINKEDIFYLSLNYGSTTKISAKKISSKLDSKHINLNSDDQIEQYYDRIGNIGNNDKRESKYPDFILVSSDYTYNQSTFNEIVEDLFENCDCYKIIKSKNSITNIVFKTSIEHIQTIARNKIIS